MLRWRLLLGAVFIAALIGLFTLDYQAPFPGVVLFPLALLLSWLAAGEILWLLAARDLRPRPGIVRLGALAVVASNLVAAIDPTTPLASLGWPAAAFALAVLAAFLGEMHRYERPGEVMERLGLTVMALAYVGLLLSFVAQMRLLGPEGGRLGSWGVAALASLVITVKMCDIGAYTFGRLFGRHKMSPVLSPGKTWEGAAGGIALACLGGWVALNLLAPALGVEVRFAWAFLPYGVLVGGCGILGDLAESLIKRDVGRKDSSAWMPGFGGVLDLLDSVLFAAPVAFLLWKLGLIAANPAIG